MFERIREFFRTLFTHRAIIERLEADLRRQINQVAINYDLAEEYKDGVRLLGNAIAYRIEQDTAEDAKPPSKQIRLRRPTYLDWQMTYEREHNAAWKVEKQKNDAIMKS